MGKEFPSLDYREAGAHHMGTFPCRSHQDEFGELFLLCSLAERPKQTSQAAGFPFVGDFKLEGFFERNRWQNGVHNILDLEYTDLSPFFW